jgi:hypothetical protein
MVLHQNSVSQILRNDLRYEKRSSDLYLEHQKSLYVRFIENARIMLKLILTKQGVRTIGFDSRSSRQRLAAESCEHGNEPSGSTEGGN